MVVNFRSCQLLRDNLAVLGLDGDFRVVVVDNRSTAAQASAVRSLAGSHGWDAITLDTNGGFASGVNAGLDHAFATGCTSAVLLNPDVAIDATTLVALRAHVLAHPGDVVSPAVGAGTRTARGYPVVDLRHGSVRAESTGRRRLGDSDRVERWLPATCLAIHRDLLAAAGPLAEEYFMYWEDVELCRRCVAAGGRLVLRDDLAVHHDELGTQRRATPAAKSALYYRYNCRNRLVFAARNLRRREVLRWMAWTPVASWRILMQGGRRQLIVSPGLLWAAVRGSAEGLARAASALVGRR